MRRPPMKHHYCVEISSSRELNPASGDGPWLRFSRILLLLHTYYIKVKFSARPPLYRECVYIVPYKEKKTTSHVEMRVRRPLWFYDVHVFGVHYVYNIQAAERGCFSLGVFVETIINMCGSTVNRTKLRRSRGLAASSLYTIAPSILSGSNASQLI